MNNNAKKASKKGGRNPKNDKADNCIMVRFTDVEYAHFLALFEQSGVAAKAVFVKALIFDKPFRVVKIDRSALEFVTKLTSFHAQLRAVGVNYNQVVTALKSNFSEKKTLALLYKLEKATIEMKDIYAKVAELSEEFNQKFMKI
jgi:hypothetical protein